MISNSYKIRMQKIQERLKETSYDAYLICNAENRYYLTGFFADDYHIDEISGYLFIKENDVLLAVDSRYITQAEAQTGDIEVLCYNKLPEKMVTEVLKKMSISSLGFEKSRISVGLYEKLQRTILDQNLKVRLIPDDGLVEADRLTKAPEEIDAIQKSLHIAEQAFLKTIASLTPTMTEKEIAWLLETEIRQLGADSLSFPTIVAAGPNAALPHATPSDQVVGENTPILFDWGARMNGYCSDTSRTVVLGKPGNDFVNAFKALVDTQHLVTEEMASEKNTKVITQKAHDYLEKRGFKATKFAHGLGHGIGLATHEAPSLSLLREKTLKHNTIVTVEPGIYIPNKWGIRVENMVVVKNDSVEVLNQLPVHYDILNIL